MGEHEEPTLFAWTVEILSLTVVRTMGTPGVVLLLRPDPEDNLSPLPLFLSQEQTVFLRDTLNVLLNDKRSWLHLANKAQQAMRLPDDFGFELQPEDDIPF